MGIKLAVVFVVAVVSASAAVAGPIERACNKSDRKSVSRPLCNCVQQVADLTLDARDQRLAATFFSDPHRAQVIRQSDDRGHEAFWKRYKQFGASAEGYCRSVRS
ncbi:hypothetical protein [Litoreibacter arenae]|uniref:Uncharacterized protein n=1 Tax=Litoreibacter arenae DSM 19593 TaxID=1123360 RepID=S9QHE6_9RHOB|nr:hypothetical protein [Litoreibacter arenae]EPX80891.1 hypothetical protein thalar_01113 [Litoreibacter arenae DSM 19593]